MKEISYLQMLCIPINIRPISSSDLRIKLNNSCPIPLVPFCIYVCIKIVLKKVSMMLTVLPTNATNEM